MGNAQTQSSFVRNASPKSSAPQASTPRNNPLRRSHEMAIEKGPQVFPREDYLRRLARVKADMAKRDIDTLVVTYDRNMNYLTGYYAPTGYVPQGLVVLAHQEEPTLILRQMDGALGHYQSYLKRESVLPYPEHLVGTS